MRRNAVIDATECNFSFENCLSGTSMGNVARFREVADSVPVFIWMFDAGLRCAFVNRPWLEFRGRRANQEIGNGWQEGIHPADADTLRTLLSRPMKLEEPLSFECRMRRHDGVYRWLAFHGSPKRDEHNAVAGYIGSCTDITERIRAEQTAHDLSGMLINAQEEERARLARELHDDITQRLARLAIDAGRIQCAAGANSATDRLAGEVRNALVQLSEDVHALSYDLHPSVLVDLGLVDALRAECSSLSRQLSIPVHVKMRDLPDAVPRKAAIAFFRIAQEALRNAVRHGCPTQIELSLWGDDGGLQLAVHDNGIGFDPHRGRSRPSLGMASMKERARLLKGELEIESEPGHGTTVIVWIPLREDTL